MHTYIRDTRYAPNRPLFFDRSNSFKLFLLKIFQWSFLPNHFEFWSQVSEEMIFFRVCLTTTRHACHVFDGSNLFKQFCRGIPNDHSCEVWLKFVQCYRRSCYLKQIVDNAQAHFEHFMLMWAKKPFFTSEQPKRYNLWSSQRVCANLNYLLDVYCWHSCCY